MTRSRTPLALVLLVILTASVAVAGGPNVVKNARHDTSPSLAQMSVGSAMKLSADKEAPEPRPTGPLKRSGRADTVSGPLAGPLTGVSTVISFDGQSANDNRRVFGFAFVPPDTNGAVGATQYVQMV